MKAAARVGDRSRAPEDSHGEECCDHEDVEGPATTGSADVLIGGQGALRVGDGGIHDECCDDQTWTAVAGAGAVFVNDRPAVRAGDATVHCGGEGFMIEGSVDVFIGDA